MDDPLLSPKNSISLSEFIPRRMVLSPAHWKTFTPIRPLEWQITKFTRTNALTVPDDKSGIYSFLVQPGIANHPGCSYLMYVGKAERQSLRKRYRQYFQDETDKSRRLHIYEMFRLWKGYIWFCFAPVEDINKIDEIERLLIHAYLPPRNHEYEGNVKRQIQKLFG